MPKRSPLVSSMFHRRLLLLLALAAGGMTVLAGQMVRLTIIQGEEHRAEAESRLVTQRWTPTVRGRILDRQGRVLALDQPSFDLAVDYRLITGDWAYGAAARAARREHAERWPKLSPTEREALILEGLPDQEAKLEALWQLICHLADLEREVLERRKHDVVRSVKRMADHLHQVRVRLEREEWELRERATTFDPADVARRPIREQRTAHVLLPDLEDAVAFELRSRIESLGFFEEGEVQIRDGAVRTYPHESMQVAIDRSTLPTPIAADEHARIEVAGVLTHVLGWMRDGPTAEDIEARRARRGNDGSGVDRGRYFPGDSVGVSGVERAAEHRLRGLRGLVVEHLDTGEEEITEASTGADLTLAVDVELQARVQALFDPGVGLAVTQPWHENDWVPLGTRLNGAAAVIDVASGDILALVSAPTFTRADLDERPDEIFDDERRQPWVNRPIARPYQPGSIVKPLVLVDAVSRGAHRLDDYIECSGHFLPNRQDVMRCWIYRERYGFMTHSRQVGGPLEATQAIARSCNIYFYTLGQSLGADGMRAMYQALGVGEAYDLGLPEAVGGFLGRLDGAPLERSDAIFMGIGQGPVSWTTLHAADAYATLARRGVRLTPRIDLSDERRPQDLRWDRYATDHAIEGLHLGVAEPYGTGHHLTIDGAREPIFNAPGIRVSGKTGTAQASPVLQRDDSGQIVRDGAGEPIPIWQGEHAWTTILAGPENEPARFAIAVLVEYGGSGGRVAGPIANQIVHALIAEGYLPESAQ